METQDQDFIANLPKPQKFTINFDVANSFVNESDRGEFAIKLLNERYEHEVKIAEQAQSIDRMFEIRSELNAYWLKLSSNNESLLSKLKVDKIKLRCIELIADIGAKIKILKKMVKGSEEQQRSEQLLVESLKQCLNNFGEIKCIKDACIKMFQFQKIISFEGWGRFVDVIENYKLLTSALDGLIQIDVSKCAYPMEKDENIFRATLKGGYYYLDDPVRVVERIFESQSFIREYLLNVEKYARFAPPPPDRACENIQMNQQPPQGSQGRYLVKCGNCGKEFYADRKSVKFCLNNKRCSNAAKQKRARSRKALNTPEKTIKYYP